MTHLLQVCSFLGLVHLYLITFSTSH
jgi:hypothetical protein